MAIGATVSVGIAVGVLVGVGVFSGISVDVGVGVEVKVSVLVAVGVGVGAPGIVPTAHLSFPPACSPHWFTPLPSDQCGWESCVEVVTSGRYRMPTTSEGSTLKYPKRGGYSQPSREKIRNSTA